jgi:hypothetical protein
MEIKQENSNIMATFMPKDGYLFKRSCVSLSIVANGVEYPIKLTHESKAFSDFHFHKKEELIQTTFIFYVCTPAGVWYNFSTLENLFQFLGLIYDKMVISEDMLLELKEQSKFSQNELGA